MPCCAVYGCKNRGSISKENQVSFFRFPKSVTLRNKWLLATGRQDTFNLNNARMCSVHFDHEFFEKDMKNRLRPDLYQEKKQLTPDAVPKVFPHMRKTAETSKFLNT